MQPLFNSIDSLNDDASKSIERSKYLFIIEKVYHIAKEPFFLIFWAKENSVTRVPKEVLPSVKGNAHEDCSTVHMKDGKNVYSD